MRNAILTALLALSSTNAAAAWFKVAGNDSVTGYADPVTIRKAGDRVKIWGLFDFKAERRTDTGKPYKSSALHYEFNCREGQVRMHYFSLYSGNMNRGRVVRSAITSDQGWTRVPPGSIDEALLKFACAKR